MLTRQGRVVALLSLLVALSSAHDHNYGGVTIVYPETAETAQLNLEDSPTMRYSPIQSYYLKANVTLFPFFTTCSRPSTQAELDKIKGKIVLFSFGDYCSPQEKAVMFAELGAVGALHTEVSAVPPDWDSLSRDGAFESRVTIPVNMISRTMGLNFMLQSRLTQGLNVTVVMTHQPSNLIDASQQGWFIFFQVSAGAIYMGVFIASVVKLGLFIKQQKGPRFSLPQLALLTTLIVSGFCFLAVTIDPMGVRGVWDNVTHVFMRDFSITIPIIPALIFPFYWGELVSTTQPIVGLKASRLPFLLAGLLLFSLLFSVSLIRGLYGNNVNALLAMVSISLLIYFLVAVFFIVAGVRVLMMLRTMQDGRRTPVQTRMTILVMLCGALLIAWSLCFVTILHTTTSWVGGLLGVYMGCWYINAAMLCTIAAVLSPAATEATAASAISTGHSSSSL